MEINKIFLIFLFLFFVNCENNPEQKYIEKKAEGYLQYQPVVEKVTGVLEMRVYHNQFEYFLLKLDSPINILGNPSIPDFKTKKGVRELHCFFEGIKSNQISAFLGKRIEIQGQLFSRQKKDSSYYFADASILVEKIGNIQIIK